MPIINHIDVDNCATVTNPDFCGEKGKSPCLLADETCRGAVKHHFRLDDGFKYQPLCDRHADLRSGSHDSR